MHEILTHLPAGETLIHAGFALVGTSYLVHNQLALRMLAIAAYAVFAVAVVRIQSPAMETLLSWYAVFMLIAGVRIVWILHDRRPLRVLAWPREELAGRMRRCAATRSAVHAAIGSDLARKLAGNTLALTRPARIEARGPGVAVPAFEAEAAQRAGAAAAPALAPLP